MDIVELMHALEGAWSHALPGHEAAERDAMLRELQRLLEQCETRGASRSDRAWSGTSGYVAECERFFSRERLASALRFKPENICSV